MPDQALSVQPAQQAEGAARGWALGRCPMRSAALCQSCCISDAAARTLLMVATVYNIPMATVLFKGSQQVAEGYCYSLLQACNS